MANDNCSASWHGLKKSEIVVRYCLDETASVRDGVLREQRTSHISTTNPAPMAEIKKNRSEKIAKE
jgi:hypothetical protein